MLFFDAKVQRRKEKQRQELQLPDRRLIVTSLFARHSEIAGESPRFALGRTLIAGDNAGFRPRLRRVQRIGRGTGTILLLLLALVLSACGASEAAPSTAGSCGLGLAQGVSDTEAITALLRAEGELVVSQQIEELMALWAAGGEVVDAKHTPDDNADDQRWMDLDAVRHRYVRIVFPGNPQPSAPPDLEIDQQGDSAIIRATTRIGSEVAPGGDRWEVVRQNGCWLIQRLSYNLETQ